MKEYFFHHVQLQNISLRQMGAVFFIFSKKSFQIVPVPMTIAKRWQHIVYYPLSFHFIETPTISNQTLLAQSAKMLERLVWPYWLKGWKGYLSLYEFSRLSPLKKKCGEEAQNISVEACLYITVWLLIQERKYKMVKFQFTVSLQVQLQKEHVLCLCCTDLLLTRKPCTKCYL